MDERKQELESARRGFAYRMTLSMRIQHIFFGLCLLILSLTGLALLLGDSDFGRWLVALEGGFENRGIIHRVAAIGLIISVVFHLAYSLFSESGSREFRRRFIGRQDLKQLAGSFRYSVGRLPTPPAIGKYSFGQKLHYWLAGFFSLTMILSGLALWNPTATMSLLPQWVMPVLLALHGYEGVLLFIVIIVWHLYDAHLSPGNFPMSNVWLSGRMPLDKAKELHRLEYERLMKMIREADE